MYIQKLPQIKKKFRVQVQIFNAKTYEKIYENDKNLIIERAAGENIVLDFGEDQVNLQGDLFFKIMHISGKDAGSDKMICRFGLHTSFLNRDQN